MDIKYAGDASHTEPADRGRPVSKSSRQRADDALRQVIESRLSELTRLQIDKVGEALGVHPLPAVHRWPGDGHELTREFLQCVAANDLERLRRPDNIFEQLGGEAARGGWSSNSWLLAFACPPGSRTTTSTGPSSPTMSTPKTC